VCGLQGAHSRTTAALDCAYANKLFGLLAVIDFTWAMIVLFLERHELEGWIAGFLKKLMTISFFYALLINQSTWFPAIINSFVQIGQQAGGVSGYLNPSSILWTGVQISGAILAACLPSATAGATAGGIVGVLVPGAGAALTAASLIPALVALFCALLIFLAYVVITLTFIMANSACVSCTWPSSELGQRMRPCSMRRAQTHALDPS
jgi:type IV secretion system protein TrbL